MTTLAVTWGYLESKCFLAEYQARSNGPENLKAQGQLTESQHQIAALGLDTPGGYKSRNKVQLNGGWIWPKICLNNDLSRNGTMKELCGFGK